MTENNRLKIAYLCDLSPHESWTYSGGNSRIYKALQKHVGDVHVLSNHWYGIDFIRKLLHRAPDSINLRARWRIHLLLSRIIAKGVAREMSLANHDVLFCAYSFHALADIEEMPRVLKVFTSDALPTVYKQSAIGAQFESSIFSRLFDPLVQRAENKVLNSADVNIWPSNWLKKATDKQRAVLDNRSVVVPWGANISTPPPPSDPPILSPDQPVRILLVGRDWRAKGGPKVVEMIRILRSRGIDAKLTVVGCTPDDQMPLDDITVHPNLDKNVPEQFAKFEDLFKTSHFLVMPSFESYGFVFCEASAYGLPSIGLRVGGVQIVDGTNGHALPYDADAQAFADQIIFYLDHPAAYTTLRMTSRAYFDEFLNWESWGKKVSEILRAKLAQKRSDT